MRTLLLVFSGTGNSLYVAKKIQQKLLDAEIEVITRNVKVIEYGKYDRIGFIFPLYYYRLPLLVSKFLVESKLPLGKYYFSIVTRGVFPEGGALAQLKRLLKRKEIKLNYGSYITMPLNDVTFYKPQSKRKQLLIIQASEKSIDNISKSIEYNKCKISFEPVGIFSTLISRLLFSNPHAMDRYFSMDIEVCTKCGLCSSICPADNIGMQPYPVWNNQCEMCLRCFNYCPQNAIMYKNVSSKKYQYRNPFIDISEIISMNK